MSNKRIPLRQRRLMIITGLLSISLSVGAITSAQIIPSVMSSNCLEYRIKGTCFWLKCSWRGCRIRTSVKITHYVPDLVVSVYNHTGQSPWSEMKYFNTSNSMAQGGGDTNVRHSGEKTKIRFKEADVFGHPGGAMFSRFASTFGMFCPVTSQAYQPYFLSALDFLAWRQNMPEQFYPEAVTFGVRELGSTSDIWGNIYPRAGAVTQTHDYKAAAVVAQRVVDVVTCRGQPHVYTPHSPSSSKGFWPPAPVQENNKNHKWQMLSPKRENSCARFPDRGVNDIYSDKIDSKGSYTWALWRQYLCCKKRGQTLLYTVDF